MVAQAATSVAAIKLTSSLHDIMDQGVQENEELQKEKLYIEVSHSIINHEYIFPDSHFQHLIHFFFFVFQNEYTRQTSVMSLMQNRVDNAIDVHTTTKLSGDYIIDSVIVDGVGKIQVLNAIQVITFYRL